MSFVFGLVAFLVVVSVIILAHEAGHFFVARLFGVGIEEFALGFPPRITSVATKRTRYAINSIPLGGYVRLQGEELDAQPKKGDFSTKSWYARAAIVVAGIGSNIILAFIILSITYLVGFTGTTAELNNHAKIKDPRVGIIEVLSDSHAQKAGVTAGDTLLAINDTTVLHPDDVMRLLETSMTTNLRLRTAQQTEYVVTIERLNEEEKIGIGYAGVARVSYPPYWAAYEGVKSTALLTKNISIGFYNLFRKLVVEQKVAAELSGPIGIAYITKDILAISPFYLLQFTAILSVNIALLNLLPIPGLDGGKFLFLLVELIKRKPVAKATEARVQQFGFLLLLLIVIATTYRDIVHILTTAL